VRTSLLDAKEEAAGLTLNSAKLEKMTTTCTSRPASASRTIQKRSLPASRGRRMKSCTQKAQRKQYRRHKTNFFYVHFVAN